MINQFLESIPKGLRKSAFVFGCLNVLLLLSITTLLAQPTSSRNYVISNAVKQTGITTETGVNSLPVTVQGKTQTITYFDGLGRPLQKIVTQGSATQKDLVTAFEYDNYGREIKKNLPYADAAGTGSYKDRAAVDLSNFYKAGQQNIPIDNYPSSLSVLESSPLNRVLAQGAPGSDWQPNSNAYDPNSHTVQMQYLYNKMEDSVRQFTVDSAGNISSSGFYPASQLSVMVTSDEQHQTVRSFTDKTGHVIVKRVLIASDSLQTYYLYDRQEMLRAVIQPEGTARLKSANWTISLAFSKAWMFLYRYDPRNRMVMKKIPGADSVNMIYDQWDRLVLTQDGNMRIASPKQYLFTKYDGLNRPIITGQITDTRAISAVVADIAAASGRFETVSTSATEGYTLTGTFPSSASYTLTVYTITHYDSYANLPSWSSGYSFVNEYSIASQNNNLNGQVVATQTRVLGTSTFYRKVSYYDDKCRVTQSIWDNAAGGKDRITNILSFEGKVTNDYHTHTSRFYTTNPLVTKQVYSYDHMDRLLSVTHQTLSQEVVTVAQNTYNELGQLLTKKLHQSTSHPLPLQKLDYAYNIRGWLKSINQPDPTKTGYEESDLFNLNLNYNQISIANTSLPQYNGNISEVSWKSGYDEYQRGYTLLYDQANRLNTSTYCYLASNQYGNFWSFTRKYNEDNISYDRNGNFIELDRYHGDYNKIDYLNYRYDSTSNQLIRVDDFNQDTTFLFKYRNNNGAADYAYDANGNMIKDFNKSISSIAYNYLNLPNIVTLTGKGAITYTYDAAGNKLQKTILDQTTSPNKTINYYYAGDYIYRNDTLEFASHPEGRLRPVRVDTTQPISFTNLKYIYEYFLKDHLGSVRSVLTTEQQTDFYAATMETATAIKEDALFSNVSPTSSAKPSGMTNDASNQKASKLNGAVNTNNNKRVGPAIVLKVMAGDTISLSVWTWYSGPAQAPATGTGIGPIFNDLFPLLTSGIISAGGTKGGTIPTSTSSPLLTGDIANLIKSDSLQYLSTPNRPKAFLNWMVVDEEFAAVSSPNHVSGIQVPTVNAGDTLKQIVGLTNLIVRRNGWIYVYVSNESNQDVYFDNLVVSLKHGPLVEQTDYYAFGTEIPGLSTKALKPSYFQNRYKFNGGNELQSKELLDGSGLELYDAVHRFYDPLTGRFNQVDPASDATYNLSNYSYANNNPLCYNDPLGLKTDTLPEVKVTAQAKVPAEFVPYINFSNHRSGVIAGKEERGLALQRKNDLFYAWWDGTGSENRIYPPDHFMTNQLKNSRSVNMARVYFYKKYLTNYKSGMSLKGASVTNYDGSFGILGLILSGTNVTEQFVGTMKIDIHVDENGQNLLFILSNKTSVTSGSYQILASHDRSTGNEARGNLNQIYIFAEPISKTDFDSADPDDHGLETLSFPPL